MFDLKDGGFLSRKLLLALVITSLMLFSWLLTGWIKALAPQLNIIIDGLETVYAMYLGGNLTGKFMVNRAALKKQAIDADSTEDDSEESVEVEDKEKVEGSKK